jgi:hypothetical protein
MSDAGNVGVVVVLVWEPDGSDSALADTSNSEGDVVTDVSSGMESAKPTVWEKRGDPEKPFEVKGIESVRSCELDNVRL